MMMTADRIDFAESLPTDDQATPQSVLDARLDDLLIRWHRYTAGYSLHKKPGCSPVFRDAKTWSRSARDEEQESQAERAVMRVLDEQIDSVPQPWRTALAVQARNLATGFDVWTSPRLPASKAEREVLLLEARTRLLRILVAAGTL